MNSARTTVESFGGSLRIETKPGKGSKFILQLPLNMAIIQALLVKISEETYTIPLANISEVIKIKTENIKTMEHHQIVSYRDTVLPLVYMREKFGIKKSLDVPSPYAGRSIMVVVVEVGQKKAGLVVDELLGQQEVVIKTLSGLLRNVRGVAGATILGNGRVAMIVDVPSLV